MKKQIENIEGIVWPTDNPIIIENFLQTGINLLKEKIGALSQNPNNPLSRVCVANSCFSLEPVRGCPVRCAYCVSGNECRNLLIDEKLYEKSINEINIQKIFPRSIEVLFSGEILAEAMVSHPAFIKNKSIVSVAAGSSEAFLPGVEKETWKAMKFLADNGLKNPFWLIVKTGIPDEMIEVWSERFLFLKNKGIKVIISITDSNAPIWLEPYKKNRFRNYDKVRQSNVYLSHHLRPIIAGINDSKESLEKALGKSLGIVESVCVGGLRIDPGIIILWKYINKYDPSILSNFYQVTRGKPVEKNLPNGITNLVQKIIKEKNFNIPVFSRSSQVLSHVLNIDDFNLYEYRVKDPDIFLRVPIEKQNNIEQRQNKRLSVILREIAKSIKLDMIKFQIEGENIKIEDHLNYQEHRLLIHAIGHSQMLS